MIAYIAAGLICLIIHFVYVKLSSARKYWERKGVKGPKPGLIAGNLDSISTKEYSLRSLGIKCYDLYPNEPYVGVYLGITPALVIRDPEIIKTIFIQDFATFVNRGFKITDGVLSKNLFEEESDHWRMLRQRISPIFTTGKLKRMMPILNNCVTEYIQYINKLIDNNKSQEMKELTTKYTIKSITSVAFGFDLDIFNSNADEFIDMAEKVQSPKGLVLAALLNSIVPGTSAKFMNLIDPKVTDFFVSLVKQIVKEREGKVKVRNDFMDLMIDMKESGKLTRTKDGDVAELEITDELIAAQAVVFYVGGFDTSSATMSFLLYELARNPSIQNRCYAEIKEIMDRNNGVLEYDSLSEFKYTSMAFDETLRKYPIASELFREADSTYTFQKTNLTIDKGTKLLIPVLSIQNDPKYFPNPEKFDPDRFSPENKNNIQDGTYIPFGDGPRICIGMRFGKVQSLLAIAHFLYNFRVETSEKTMKSFKYDKKSLTLGSAEGFWLDVKRR